MKATIQTLSMLNIEGKPVEFMKWLDNARICPVKILHWGPQGYIALFDVEDSNAIIDWLDEHKVEYSWSKSNTHPFEDKHDDLHKLHDQLEGVVAVANNKGYDEAVTEVDAKVILDLVKELIEYRRENE